MFVIKAGAKKFALETIPAFIVANPVASAALLGGAVIVVAGTAYYLHQEEHWRYLETLKLATDRNYIVSSIMAASCLKHNVT